MNDELCTGRDETYSNSKFIFDELHNLSRCSLAVFDVKLLDQSSHSSMHWKWNRSWGVLFFSQLFVPHVLSSHCASRDLLPSLIQILCYFYERHSLIAKHSNVISQMTFSEMVFEPFLLEPFFICVSSLQQSHYTQLFECVTNLSRSSHDWKLKKVGSVNCEIK